MATEHGIVTQRPGNRRNLAIDGLRGLCLVLMTMDHLPGNPLQRFSNYRYGPFGFFTAASGFVFLSGWVTGQVYGRYQQTRESRVVFGKIAARMWKLYLAQVILILGIYAAVALHLRGTFTNELVLFRMHPLKGLLMGLTLLQQPEYLGILPMYFLFLALAPLVLWQIQTGHRWRVVIFSISLWCLSGLFLKVPNDSTGVNFGFSPLGYQLLFVIGMVLGEMRFRLDALASRLRKFVVVSSLAGAAALFALRFDYGFAGPVRIFVDRWHVAFSLDKMGPVRVLSFALFCVVLASVFQKKNLINTGSAAYQWLILLGQNSLAVFVWSILLTYAIVAVIPVNASLMLRIADFAFAAASLTIPAWLSAQGIGERIFKLQPFAGGLRTFRELWAHK